MAERLKDQFFTQASLQTMAAAIVKQDANFDTRRFKQLLFDSEWENRELKQRMRHTSQCLRQTLPEGFADAVGILLKIAPEIKGFEGMVLPDFVELYGQSDWDLSLSVLAELTKTSSAEFAIRPFLDQQPEKTMMFMQGLAESQHENVRRFASEGCRPRLPWAMGLPKFKKDPSLILPILEKLKNDRSEFVRRSVANNLNDISKDHPDLVLEIAEKWFGKSVETDRIIKHACRSLLKSGQQRALLLFGFEDPKQIEFENFLLDKTIVTLGDEILFSGSLLVKSDQSCKVRLEYGVYFMKANGKLSKKVFQISEKVYQPGAHPILKKHKFIDMTTRKHHEGIHEISVIINGKEKVKQGFELKKM